MRPELRELLELAAGDGGGSVDLDRVVRAARRRSFARRSAITAAAALGAAGAIALLSTISLPQTADNDRHTRRFSPDTVELPPSVLGPLARGDYLAEAFRPQFSFRIDREGWSAKLLSQRRVTLVYRRRLHLEMLRFDAVYEQTRDGRVGPVNLDGSLLAWLQAHPRLKTEEATPIYIGTETLEGREARAARTMPRTTPGCTRERCIPLARSKGNPNPFVVEADRHYAFYVMDTPGGSIVIIIHAAPAAFDDEALEARSLVGTIKVAAAS